MSEVGTFFGGLSGKTKADFGDGDAFYITYMNVYSNIAVDCKNVERVKVGAEEKQNEIHFGDALFTGSSETPDECGMSSVMCSEPAEKVYLNSFCFGFRLNDDYKNKFNPKFMKHLYRGRDLRRQIIRTASGVTRFNVSKKKFGNVMLPLIPLQEQERIANILDRFESLTTSLAAGLPAEIAARRRQYEHYRDRLLTFRRKVARGEK